MVFTEQLPDVQSFICSNGRDVWQSVATFLCVQNVQMTVGRETHSINDGKTKLGRGIGSQHPREITSNVKFYVSYCLNNFSSIFDDESKQI